MTITLAFDALYAVLFLCLGAAFQHVFVGAFVRPREGFGTTLKIVAYSNAVLLLSWIPLLGYVVSFYVFYVIFVGIRELHDTTTRRALLGLGFSSYLLLWAAGIPSNP